VRLNKNPNAGAGKVELQIAPLIDVVFLLLIYFMVTASLIKKEADISFVLPANVPQDAMTDIPVEVIIEIDPDGTVILEGMQFPAADEVLQDLASQIRVLKQVAASQNSPFFVNLLPHRDATHNRVVDVMDACAAAEVDSLTFSKSL
jgi:biopolymer transport protein ExbD